MAKRAKRVAERHETFTAPYLPAKFGFGDEVILPWDTTLKPVQALAFLATRRESTPPRKHGNIPL
jgi:acetyl-CoA carboxylase carboxyltransferase component